MTDQGRVNYEGYYAAMPGSSPVPFDELPHAERLRWDAGATFVELWLAGAPVDEDMPGGELASVTAELGRLREQLAEARELGTAWRRERDALAAENAEAVRALDLARDEITALRNLAADILGEFKPAGDGHRARIGQVGYARWAERAGLGG
jgi:hypothetical protein